MEFPSSTSTAVCVIGAGVAGMCAMKALSQAGIGFDCFEERDRVGGIWAYEEAPGRTCAWAMLNMNSPRGTYDFSDFPMPAHYPDFPRREQVWEYLDRAVDHYGFRSAIRFGTGVARVEKDGNGWRVTTKGGDATRYDAVVIANGHHNTPRLPQVEGRFAGSVIHSGDFRRRERYAGRRVLVVGYGNSGAQIAVDVSFAAAQTLLAMRSGTWVLPHYVRGIRVDRVFDTRLTAWLPFRVDDAISTWLYRLVIGRPDRHGLPKPARGMSYIFPTIAESLFNRLGDGRIHVTREPTRFDGRMVTFADGEQAEVDDVIYATGYETTFPFLDENVLSGRDNRLRLYMRTFLPDDPSLTVIGGYQAHAQWGFLPLMEAQARLVAGHLGGTYALPPREEMLAAIERDQREVARQFVDTPRHHYQMVGPIFIRRVAAELKRGARRARAAARAAPQGVRLEPAG